MMRAGGGAKPYNVVPNVQGNVGVTIMLILIVVELFIIFLIFDKRKFDILFYSIVILKLAWIH